MTFRIHVIGTGGQRPAVDFHDLLASCPVVSRFEDPARAWLGENYELAATLDGLFDSAPISEIVPSIISAFADFSGDSAACVYLVPGAGQVGDETVARLAGHFDVRVIGGCLDLEVPLGDAQIIDALVLAEAEDAYPFDGGWATPDPVRPIVVTNLRGRAVVPLALRRLRRAHPVSIELERFDDDATIIISPDTDPGPVRSYLGLERIVATLRSPGGCPWDRQQSVETLIPMMLEEIDEFLEASRTGGPPEQADELGDVLLHIAMIAQIAREQHGYGIEDVLEAITGKMVRRHPHVFGDVEVASIDELYEVWQQVKDSERSRELSRPRDNRSGG